MNLQDDKKKTNKQKQEKKNKMNKMSWSLQDFCLKWLLNFFLCEE